MKNMFRILFNAAKYLSISTNVSMDPSPVPSKEIQKHAETDTANHANREHSKNQSTDSTPTLNKSDETTPEKAHEKTSHADSRSSKNPKIDIHPTSNTSDETTPKTGDSNKKDSDNIRRKHSKNQRTDTDPTSNKSDETNSETTDSNTKDSLGNPKRKSHPARTPELSPSNYPSVMKPRYTMEYIDSPLGEEEHLPKDSPLSVTNNIILEKTVNDPAESKIMHSTKTDFDPENTHSTNPSTDGKVESYESDSKTSDQNSNDEKYSKNITNNIALLINVCPQPSEKREKNN